MSLVRWDPIREFEDMSERINRLLARPMATTDRGREAMAMPDWAPAVDISETPEEFLVKADLPEVKKEDFKVHVENGVLLIKGDRRQEKEEKGKQFHRIERSYGSFMRSFSLPDGVDESKISAEFKDGVLNVHLPKGEKAKPKTVDVKIS